MPWDTPPNPYIHEGSFTIGVEYRIINSYMRENMKDSSKLLSFNVNRNLKFKEFRGVDFNTGRKLLFDVDRGLSFDVNRDLGFGKRGVVFRGYVCPVCGAPVAKDAAECDECGVQFEQNVRGRKEKPAAQTKKWTRGERQTTKPKTRPKSGQKRRSTFECPICGKMLYVGTARCPGCDTIFDLKSGSQPDRKVKAQQQGRSAAPGVIYCNNCNYRIPPTDRFCRRCGSPRPKRTGNATVSWQDFQASGHDDGIISWDQYANRNLNENRGDEI